MHLGRIRGGAALVLGLALLLAGCTAAAQTPTHAPGAPASPGSGLAVTAVPSGLPATPASAAPSPGATPGPASTSGGRAAQVAIRWPSPIPGLQPSPSFFLRIPILMYHRIVPAGLAGDSLPGLVISPALFDAQLAALHAAGWHTVTVAQISQALQLRRSLPPRTFAISIDDGWNDGYTYALPILQRYGFHATYYVIAGRVGVWKNVLSPAQLRALVAAGMEIGDHTLNHRQLPSLSAAQMHVQVATAARLLAGFVGQRPATFAYPSGRYNLASEQEIQADGFGMAVIEGSGAWEAAADRFAVPRVRVSPSTTPAQLLGTLRALEPGS
ncbi:MAG: polysaccharide deacetylase family protein [Candidatus Limnocylindrales bacterium]